MLKKSIANLVSLKKTVGLAFALLAVLSLMCDRTHYDDGAPLKNISGHARISDLGPSDS